MSCSLIIIGCSQRKKKTSRLLPAIDRYDGPMFHVLRKYVSEKPEVQYGAYILSGRFGLINAEFPTPRYSHRLTSADILSLRASVDSQVKEAVDRVQPESVFVSVGSQYWPLLEEPICREISSEKLNIASGSIGGRASQLAHWLRSGNTVGESKTVGILGEATLLGATIRLTWEQVLRRGNEARSIDPEGALRFQTWFVELGNTQVAPKWLASLLFDKPVSKFRTADARRVLADLGLSVRHISTLTN